MIEGSRKYRFIGGALTLVWCALVLVYLIVSEVNPLDLKPNEFGDFLAGILGPIGILWIVLGFWQQGDELRSSVKALNLQSEELKNSVEQQKALVEVTREQAEAELRALQEERQARRLANLPNLHLRARGGSRSGTQINTGFHLRNLGAPCTEIRIVIVGDPVTIVGTIPALDYGDEQTIQFQHSPNDHMECEIEITFVTKEREVGSVSFRATRREEGAIGFDISRIE